MSKNITIQEGGTPYQFTAKKLKTDKIGGGSVLWVPEEETVLTKKKITEEGTYKASDEGYYGYSEVEVDVTGATSTKRITQNGTYKAEDDGLIGYSKVKVNVRGGNGSADSSGKPRVTFDPDGNIEDAPGGIGSSIFGTDPNTGEWTTVGVDSNGNLVYTQIPASIDIITPPTKTSYTDGESINYSGIVVGLKTKSGNTFTDSVYTNGRIPMQELIFQVTNASASQATENRMESSLVTSIPQPIKYSISNYFLSGKGTDEQGNLFTNGAMMTAAMSYDELNKYVGTYPMRFVVVENVEAETCTVWRISEAPIHSTAYFIKDVPGGGGEAGQAASYTFDGKTVYCSGMQFAVNNPSAFRSIIDVIPDYISGYGSDFNVDGPTAWTIWYGNPVGGEQSIPVRWKSRYDGRTLEDTFNITVIGSGGNSGSGSGSTGGGGYSDDSGGSSSGGGGGF